MDQILIWQGMQDSNLRIHESKSCALPTWLIPNIYVVSAQGFEPRTHALEGRCSIQLSYAPTLYGKFGAGEGDRTLTAGLEGRNSTIELHPHI